MNTMNVIVILAGALAGAMLFLMAFFYLVMREINKANKDLLNRLMARDFTEYIRGEATLHPAKEKEPERHEEEAIPM